MKLADWLILLGFGAAALLALFSICGWLPAWFEKRLFAIVVWALLTINTCRSWRRQQQPATSNHIHENVR